MAEPSLGSESMTSFKSLRFLWIFSKRTSSSLLIMKRSPSCIVLIVNGFAFLTILRRCCYCWERMEERWLFLKNFALFCWRRRRCASFEQEGRRFWPIRYCWMNMLLFMGTLRSSDGAEGWLRRVRLTCMVCVCRSVERRASPCILVPESRWAWLFCYCSL